MWSAVIFNTRSGSAEIELKTTGPLAAASWSRVLGNTGSATHVLNLRGAGIPRSLVRELSRGNKYSIGHCWGDHVAYAGVIQNRRYNGKGQLQVRSNEIRKAILGVRYPYGVNEYNPTTGSLNAVGKSHAGAVRWVLLNATKFGTVPGWELPIDMPADGSGSFTARWRQEEKLRVENNLTQIEQDGCEIDLRPYRTSAGVFRYETRVDSVIATGTPFVIAANAPGSIAVGPSSEEDSTAQRTGLLAYGKGQGQDTPWTFAPRTGDGIGDLPVMDSDVVFDDIEVVDGDDQRLMTAVDVEYARSHDPIEQWDYSLYIGGVGPQMTDIGRVHDLQTFGDPFWEDGSHGQRVISLNGGLSYVVKPGVQTYGG